ncbi:MAG: threonylcarbamoyl-AMP synthase [Rhodospirillaceae bacterium]|nr:MAG: threonylcarbamoyl-AMP synthase [Rhodospirillaceae bacterium]
MAPADSIHIEQAASILKAGGLVAFPTETVYGLGADATNDQAVAKIFETKQRPAFNPLIIHIKNIEQAFEFAEFNDLSNQLTTAFWPGALTLVLRRKKGSKLSLLATAGLDTVAVRMPNHPVAQSLLAAANVPIAAPSANLSGTISPTQAGHVDGQFSGSLTLNMVLDGGPCTVGLESTIVDISGKIPTLLRPGGLAKEDIEAVIGPLAINASEDIIAPGQLKSHYAPSIPLRMNVKADEVKPGESLLAFGANAPTKALNLATTANLIEAAANLFAMMRTLDTPGSAGIAVMPIPNEGLGVAINDRLKRASATK